MFSRLLKFLWQLTLLQCISGRLSPAPKFYGQDSAIIIDTDKTRLNPKLQNALYYNLPVYKLINQVQSKPTQTPPPTIDEYPSDLLHLARTKLGLKNTDQLPGLTELGSLLGTSNNQETIKYVRSLTSTDQGIALMKAYLDSMEYGRADDAATEDDNVNVEDDDDDVSNNSDLDANYDSVVSKLEKTGTTEAPKPELQAGSLMDTVNEFIKQYGLWPESSTTPKPLPYKRMMVAPVQARQQRPAPMMRPVLIRQPLPYHFPIPLRPVLMPPVKKESQKPVIARNDSNPSSLTEVSKPPHMNTPKENAAPPSTQVAPHIQQLAQMANISPQVLDSFLQQQPKLAELARRVSRFPLVQQHSRAIDSQLFIAVKKALSQDKNFQRLLGEAHTLE